MKMTTTEKKIAKKIKKSLVDRNKVNVCIMDYGKRVVVTVKDVTDDTFEGISLAVSDVMNAVNMPKYSLVGEYK